MARHSVGPEIRRKTISIRITKSAGKISVHFPFELKDQFRKAFRSARWDASSRVWIVKSSAEKRLAAWVQEVEASGALEALADKSDAEMSEREIEKLRSELSAIRTYAEAKAAAIRSAGYTPGCLSSLGAEVAAARATANTVRAQEAQVGEIKAAKEAAKEAEEAAKVANVIDTTAVKEAIFQIKTAMKKKDRKHAAAVAFELRQTVEKLEEAGWESEALRSIAFYNWNRFFLSGKPRSESGIDAVIEYVRAA